MDRRSSSTDLRSPVDVKDPYNSALFGLVLYNDPQVFFRLDANICWIRIESLQFLNRDFYPIDSDWCRHLYPLVSIVPKHPAFSTPAPTIGCRLDFSRPWMIPFSRNSFSVPPRLFLSHNHGKHWKMAGYLKRQQSYWRYYTTVFHWTMMLE